MVDQIMGLARVETITDASVDRVFKRGDRRADLQRSVLTKYEYYAA